MTYLYNNVINPHMDVNLFTEMTIASTEMNQSHTLFGISRAQFLVFILLMALALLGRLLPHPPGFSPMIAVALFAGFYLRHRYLPFVLIISSMLLSDLLLGAYEVGSMMVVYLALLLPVVLGGFLRKGLSIKRLGVATIGGSLLFFIASNFAVWLFNGWYAPTLAGLIECYIAAIPFYQNALAGDLLYTALIFGVYFAFKQWIAGGSSSISRQA